MADSEILDLDALAPKKATIKLDGKLIDVNPPSTGDMIELGQLGSKMTDDNIKPSEADKLYDEMMVVLVRMVPELKDKRLNVNQLLGLVNMISDMIEPPESKELEARGISMAAKTDPKEAPSTPEQSATS